MDDIDVEDQINEDDLEDSSHQACYIFRSTRTHSYHPSKKRKLKHESYDAVVWPDLRVSEDSARHSGHRQSLLESALQQQLHNHDSRQISEEQVDKLVSFLQSTSGSVTQTRISTALVLTGLDNANHQMVLDTIAAKLSEIVSSVLIDLHARQCLNLQIALKSLIRSVIQQHSGIAAYNDFLVEHKRLFPLNYDLELLERFVEKNAIKKIAISLSDVEDFDGSTMNELIKTLQLWHSRLPIVLILGVTSTRDLFEHRLSKSTLKNLQVCTFEFIPRADQNSDLIRTAQIPNFAAAASNGMMLGPNTMKALYEFSQGQGHTTQSLTAYLKYLFMSHFAANPVSEFSSTDDSLLKIGNISLAPSAIRKTHSFKSYCEDLLAEKNKTAVAKVKQLLKDDKILLKEMHDRLNEGKHAFTSICKIIYSFSDLYQNLSPHMTKTRMSKLEVEAQFFQCMDDLPNCQAFDDVCSCLMSLESWKLVDVFNDCDSLTISNLGLSETVLLLRQEGDISHQSTGSSNSIHETNSKAKSASKRGKSAQASKASARSSKQKEKSDASAARELITALEKKLHSSSLDISSLVLHEVYIVSSRMAPTKQNFDPQPRATMERALLRPGDYLACDCCGGTNHGTSSGREMGVSERSKPPVCLLFALLQEAPTIVNVRDLYDAFSSRLNEGTRSGDDGQGESVIKTTMFIFYRALAALKMIGLVKSSTGTQVKKRSAGGRGSKSVVQDIDFIAKTGWATM